MERVAAYHREAMELAEAVASARRGGDTENASVLLREAYEKERFAALAVADQIDLEPTRSILLRSAASLAIQCRETRDAERLVSQALYGNPPEEIANELRDLLEQVNFHRHLDLRGIILEPNEFQVSLSGPSVGFGLAHSDQFVDRVRSIETLIFRTAERKMGLPFREHGRPRKSPEKDFDLFLSVPRAASFAISFRLGRSDQLQLPGMNLPEVVVGEVLDCLDLMNRSEMDALRQRMPDEAYFVNFQGLARSIAPDGEAIRTVGLTAVRGGEERRVLLDTPRNQVPIASASDLKGEAESDNVVEVRGTLQLADARRKKEGVIELIDEEGVAHKVKVPRGMMGDVVRPMFDSEVIVTGRRLKGRIFLETISKPDDVR